MHPYLRNFDLNLLPVLSCLIEHTNTTKVANILGITQPAVSHALSRCRAYFDDPLLVKTGKSLTLTPFGESLKDELSFFLEISKDIVSKRSIFDPKTSDFTFHIAMSAYAETVLIPDIVEILKLHAPSTSVYVSFVSRFENWQDIVKNKTGLYCTNLVPKLPFHSVSLFEEHFICAYQKSLVDTKSLTKLDYTNANHIRVGVSGLYNSIVDDNLESHGVSRKIKVSVPNYLLGLKLAEKTNYIVTLPQNFITPHLKNYNLKFSKYPFDFKLQTINMIWHPRVNDDPAYKWLRQKIIEKIETKKLFS